jgi:hypothetical protein
MVRVYISTVEIIVLVVHSRKTSGYVAVEERKTTEVWGCLTYSKTLRPCSKIF